MNEYFNCLDMMMSPEFISSDLFSVNRTLTLREEVCIADHMKCSLGIPASSHGALSESRVFAETEAQHLLLSFHTLFRSAMRSHSILQVVGQAQGAILACFVDAFWGCQRGPNYGIIGLIIN